jgi:hypothetical protein
MEIRQFGGGLHEDHRTQTSSMFKRYADLFSDEEQRAQQRAVQNRRREWKKAQAANVVTMPTRTAVQ